MNKGKNILKKIRYRILNWREYENAKFILKKLNGKSEKIVYILTCGPSLELYLENKKLRSHLEKSFCISVKQAFDLFQKETNIHIVNEIRYKEYDYSVNRPLILSTGELNQSIRKDAHFPIIDYRYETSIFATNNYENSKLSKFDIFRPWGIGVMYELGLFLPELLNAKKVVIIGFDMNNGGKYHFYDNLNTEDSNSYSVDKDEFFYNQQTIPFYEKWMNEKGVEVALMSPLSSLPFKNKITQRDELEDFIIS